tara:strand:- start:43 stop:189 length:147 start_codon:yes stop_codon:yes gene_type:complete
MSLLQKLKDRRDATNKATGNQPSKTQKKLDKALNLQNNFNDGYGPDKK